jgi:hypothetical protein
VLSPGLLVVHNTGRSGKDDFTERSGREQQVDPVLDGVNTDVKSRGDDTGLVETTVQLNDDLASTVVIDDLELSDVTYNQPLLTCIIRTKLETETEMKGTG